MRGSFDNSLNLTKLIIKRERLMTPLWIIMLVLFSVGIAVGMGDMFPAEARQALAETLNNPAMVAMMGPIFGADNFTIGAMYGTLMMLWIVMTVAVMNIFFIVRHTRADEERGRVEVIRSLPTGRIANLNAAVISAVAINAVLGLLTSFCLYIINVETIDLAGSLLSGAAVFASGLLFAAIAAVFSQLSASSRGAVGYSFLALGVFYMMRAAGDINAEILSLLSPLGLVQRSQFFIENNWLPTIVILIQAAAVFAIAYTLNAKRDLGQGILPARPGRSEASKMMRSQFGLSFRLVKNTLITWLIVMFLLGASYGSIMGDIDTFVSESEFYQALIGAVEGFSTAEMFTSMVNSIMALMAMIPLLIIALKLRSEEKEHRAEVVLSGVVPRINHLAGYAILAFIASLLLQLATALGLFLAIEAVLPGGTTLGFLLRANLVYLPALWVKIGIAILLTGLLPKITSVVWGYFAFSFFTVFLGRILNLPNWIANLSPFAFIPELPVDSINYAPLTVLTVIAVVLTAAGLVFYRKRDMDY
ncbi:MAG: ABC transporter permease [Defluviitaleaceae bacterium]|nr:ABC transporter permease [Defluviitaleaceae bacterium]